jgi:hypothetical protein
MSDGVSLLPSGSRESYRHRKEKSVKGQLAEIGRPLGDTFSFEDISYHRWAESIHSSLIMSRNQKGSSRARPGTRLDVVEQQSRCNNARRVLEASKTSEVDH